MFSSYQSTDVFSSHLDDFSATILNSLSPEALDRFVFNLLTGYFTKLLLASPTISLSDLTNIDQLITSFISKIKEPKFLQAILSSNKNTISDQLDDFGLEEVIDESNITNYIKRAIEGIKE